MKNRWCISGWSILFFLLTVGLALLSWIVSIYGLGDVQSLLGVEGIRWILSHVVDNYVQAPALGGVMIVFMGLGVVVRSGLYDVLRRMFRGKKQFSRKERRALIMSVGGMIIYMAGMLLALLFPRHLLLGVTGTWMDSPFSKGLVYILSIGIGLSGIIYGYISDTFRRLSDVVEGMSCLLASSASYFVSLFFIVQFFSFLEYTCLVDWLQIDGVWVDVAFQFCCFLPLWELKDKTVKEL